MGGLLSVSADASPPPAVVLVPPLLDRERKGRSRFAKSSYDGLFGKPQLRCLFRDYLSRDVHAVLHFSPQQDQHVSVVAKLGVPRPGGAARRGGTAQHSAAGAGTLRNGASGSVTLRYQPAPETPLTFLDVKARTQGATSMATLRGCILEPSLRLGVFGVLPMMAGGGALADSLSLGARYSSPKISTGCILKPGSNTLEKGWLVGRIGQSLLVGMQTAPDLPLQSVVGAAGAAKTASDTLDKLNAAASFCVAYQPAVRSAYGQGMFTAALEVHQHQQLLVSFLHHQAVQRNVRNPLEDSDVVGITNYIDIGFRMATDLTGTGTSTMDLAASWQANKNVMLKGRVGLDGVAAAAVFKSWWQPSFTLAAAASYDFSQQQAKVGFTAMVETYSNLRYERSTEAQKMSGARVTQRHVASPEDVAYHKGRGLLVPLDEVDQAVDSGRQRQPAGADCL